MNFRIDELVRFSVNPDGYLEPNSKGDLLLFDDVVSLIDYIQAEHDDDIADRDRDIRNLEHEIDELDGEISDLNGIISELQDERS